jgi:hypothetical protein
VKSVSDAWTGGVATVQGCVTSSVTLQMTEMDKQAANMTSACSEGELSKGFYQDATHPPQLSTI